MTGFEILIKIQHPVKSTGHKAWLCRILSAIAYSHSGLKYLKPFL
jgi:hypothetical protein